MDHLDAGQDSVKKTHFFSHVIRGFAQIPFLDIFSPRSVLAIEFIHLPHRDCSQKIERDHLRLAILYKGGGLATVVRKFSSFFFLF